MGKISNAFEALKIFNRGGIDYNANTQADATRDGYDSNFLVDYIDRRIHIVSSAELASKIGDIVYNRYLSFLTMIESDYFNGILFKLHFSDLLPIDDFIKIAERLHNEYRRICGYQNGSDKNGE